MQRTRTPDGPSILRLLTTWGDLHVIAFRGRIVACELPFRARGGGSVGVLGGTVHAASVADRDALAAARTFVEASLAGRAARCPPLAFAEGTAFQKSVWRALRRLRPGETATYGQIAAALGRPGSARAVGSACGRNPLPLFVPCHRVTGAGGSLGGFSGGLAWKRLLLALEGAQA
jgi:methylated-DNA-[protein]-cysteine S-methyltransferase